MYKVYIKTGRQGKVGVSVRQFNSFIHTRYLPRIPRIPTYLRYLPGTQQHQSLNTTTILLLVVLHYTIPFRLFFFGRGKQNRTEQKQNNHGLYILYAFS